MLGDLAHSFVTLFVVLDPIGVAVIAAGLTHGLTAQARRGIAWRSTIVAAILLALFAFAGAPLLNALGISLPALRIAGGILLLLLAIDMVFARPSGIRNPTPSEQQEAEHRSDIAVFPMAFPLLAGPGALTSIVLLMGRATSPLHQLGILAALLIVLAVALVGVLNAGRLANLLGVTGANVISRVLGIILSALAVQFVLDGATQFWPHL